MEKTTVSTATAEDVRELLDATRNHGVPDIREGLTKRTIYVPVKHGAIRVLHFMPENPVSRRPLVFVPGWGTLLEGFQDLYEVLYGRVEMYMIETREKKSSRMDRFRADFTMHRKAEDIGEAIRYLGLDLRDFVLMGSCWGSAMILQGVMDETVDAPTIVTIDPMHRLWYPQWMLNYVAPLLPVFLLRALKPVLKTIQLRNMHEPAQRKRVEAFIKNAVMWKWKRAAYHVRNFELFGNLADIKREIIVFNGTNDTIHDQRDYPKIAKELPGGRFIFMEADESDRERLMGIVAREFALVREEDGVPELLRRFEVGITR